MAARQWLVRFYLDQVCDMNLQEYIRRAEELKSHGELNTPELRVALLSSFTTNGLAEAITVKCHEVGIRATCYTGPYGQYAQEILEPESGLHTFNPNVVILSIDTRSLLGDMYLNPYSMDERTRHSWIEEHIEQVKILVALLKEKTTVILHNLSIPSFSPLGILENKQSFGFRRMIATFNEQLEDMFRDVSRVFIFDYDRWLADMGTRTATDWKMYYLADTRLSFDTLPMLADAYLSYLRPLASRSKKCLVVDLDNTLWGGVVGEDGMENLALGPTPQGRPFWELQQYLLSLFERGVILAINSRNNWDDAIRVLREHPFMVLKEKHFAAIKMNWEDKATNLRAIAEEINIGLDSLVYLDDDPANRALVRESVPDVEVVDLPADPSEYLPTILHLNAFNTIQLTEEDRTRGAMYATDRIRQEFQTTAKDMTAFLRDLDMTVTIALADPFTIPRIAQLTQKTNQFNMTTRRYTEDDIRQLAAHPDTDIYSVSAKDRFGDNGLTGVAIVKKGDVEWSIDTFLLSCRVIGRRIEETLLAYILDQARRSGASRVCGEFISTKKNAVAKDFYEKNGFTNGVYDLSRPYPYPDVIHVIFPEF